jgi:adenylate kinase family enzyme
VNNLEDQIEDIQKLAELRQRARALMQEGIEALCAKTYVPQPREGEFDEKSAARADWELPGDDVEKAEILHAFARLKPKGEESGQRWVESRNAIIRDLKSITYANVASADALDTVPIFRCALVLQALAETPGYALSRAALACFYRIVQELNEVTGPTWTSGAARAGEQAVPTAFITGECARGLLALETVLLETAKAAELLGKEAARQAKFQSDFKPWKDEEEKFRAASLRVSLGVLEPHLVISLPKDISAGTLLEKIEQALCSVDEIEQYGFPSGQKPSDTKPADRMKTIAPLRHSEAAKDIARNAVCSLLRAVSAPVVKGAESQAAAKHIAGKLRTGAQIIRDVLEPIEQFAEAVIDRQLAAASPPLGLWVDGAELVFAAVLLGLVSDWKRPKVRAAYEVVCPLLSMNGRLLSIRPFDVQEKGYRLNVQTLEVTRRLADLMAHLDVDPNPQLVKRLILPFEYTRIAGVNKSECGWTTDPPGRNSKSLWWLTAIAVDALHSVIRMLDEVINRQVLRHFHVRQPLGLKLALDDLFYPDYGLAASNKKIDGIAIKLQKLRAHAGNGPADEAPLFSLVLYGPPGTGKTTLVEAVAKSAGVPLVEITPSDVLVGGAEGVERRTRQVFEALTKLTHVVILFDEFDSILLDRTKRDPEAIPTSVIEFLTPGMLPKLKALNDASKEHRISFMLATNFVDRLDAAVTRGGRFDDKHGIYPPDVVARLGRLLDQWKRFEPDKYESGIKLPEERLKVKIDEESVVERKRLLDQELKQLKLRGVRATIDSRILNGVRRTNSGPMDRLARPGWYSVARNQKDLDGTLFGHILTGAEYADIEAEAQYQKERAKYNVQRKPKNRAKVRPIAPGAYWTDWKKIDGWEKRFHEMVEKGLSLKVVCEELKKIVEVLA